MKWNGATLWDHNTQPAFLHVPKFYLTSLAAALSADGRWYVRSGAHTHALCLSDAAAAVASCCRCVSSSQRHIWNCAEHVGNVHEAYSEMGRTQKGGTAEERGK